MASETVRRRVPGGEGPGVVGRAGTKTEVIPGTSAMDGGSKTRLRGKNSSSSSKIEFINPRPAVVADRKNA